jgi:hypothetical protein
VSITTTGAAGIVPTGQMDLAARASADPPALVPTSQCQGTRYGNDGALTAPGTASTADGAPPYPVPSDSLAVGNPPRPGEAAQGSGAGFNAGAWRRAGS